jgi:GMP synthase (glutamine-hydrolysing)
MSPSRLALALRHVQVAQQVFAWERFVLAFQCHPEVRQEDFESWLIGHANEIAAASSASVEQLRKDTQYYGPTLAACARQAFTDWLASVGL